MDAGKKIREGESESSIKQTSSAIEQPQGLPKLVQVTTRDKVN